MELHEVAKPTSLKKMKSVTIEGEEIENKFNGNTVPLGTITTVAACATGIETPTATGGKSLLKSYPSSASSAGGGQQQQQVTLAITPSVTSRHHHQDRTPTKTPGSATTTQFAAGEDTPTSAVKRAPLTVEDWQAEVKELKQKIRELRTAKLVLARKVNEDQATLFEFAKKMRSLEELAKLSQECVMEKNKLIEQMKTKLTDADKFSSERVVVDSYRIVVARRTGNSEERFAEFSILVNFVNSSRGSVQLFRRFNELRALDCRVRDAAFGQKRGLRGFASSGAGRRGWCEGNASEGEEGPSANDRMIQDAYEQLAQLRFPQTKWFGNLNEAFLNKRRGEIQEYMDGLLMIARRAGRSSHIRRVISDWFDLPNASVENDLLWRDDRIMPLSQFRTYIVASMAGTANGGGGA